MKYVLLFAVLRGVALVTEGNSIPALENFPIVGISAPAILSAFFVMFMRGDIVPRKTYQDLMLDRDYWRQAHSVSEEARLTSNKQVDVLVEGFRTVDAIAEGIRKAAGRPD